MLQGVEQEQEEAEMLEEMGEQAASSTVGKGRPLPFVKKTKTVKVRDASFDNVLIFNR
jgi:hypothetical protein